MICLMLSASCSQSHGHGILIRISCVLLCLGLCVGLCLCPCSCGIHREQLPLRPATYEHFVSPTTPIQCACLIKLICLACHGSWWGGPEPLNQNMAGKLLPRKFSTQCALLWNTGGAHTKQHVLIIKQHVRITSVRSQQLPSLVCKVGESCSGTCGVYAVVTSGHACFASSRY